MDNNSHKDNLHKVRMSTSYAKSQVNNVNLVEPGVKSNLMFRSTEDLRKSRCAAYSYLIP